MVARSVVVAAYPNSLEAGLAQGRLLQAGIASEIDGLTSQSWLAGEVPLTGFPLVVAYEHAERARAVLFEPRDAAERALDEAEVEREAALATEAEPEPPPTAPQHPPSSPEQGSHTASTAWRSATPPAAALLIGVLIWGAWTLGVALVWSFTLLRGPTGRALASRARLLLIGLMGLALLQVAALLLLGWPFEFVDERPEHSIWGWVGVDIALAVCVLVFWSVSRRTAGR